MSQFRNIREMKNNKLSRAQFSKSKIKATEHIIVGDVFEQPKKRDQTIINNNYKGPGLKQFLTNITPSDKKMYNQSQIDAKDLSSIDQDLLKMWDKLGVNMEFRASFVQKLSYFNESFHSQITSYEKSCLVKVSKLINDIIVDMFPRDTCLKFLKDAEIKLQNEVNSSNYLLKVRNELGKLKGIMTKIIGNVNKLRKLMEGGISKDKFNPSKMDNAYIFDPIFIIKLNQSLQFLREGAIGKRFNLKSRFDPLLIDLEDKGSNPQKNLLVKYAYTLLNEMIGNNLYVNKSQPSASSICAKKITKPPSKTIINANNASIIHSSIHCSLLQKKDHQFNTNDPSIDELSQVKRNQKEMIECKIIENERKNNCDEDGHPTDHLKELNVREVTDDYINTPGKECIGKENHCSPDGSLFDNVMNVYTDSVDRFKLTYREYYSHIPSSQKSVFNISQDIYAFTEGVNPLIVVQYQKDKVVSLCLLSTDPENQSTLCIKHLSSLTNDLKETIRQFISFIQSIIPFKDITIDLYHEIFEGKLQLRKDMNELFKALSFRWSKLENLENGTRFQRMKYINSSNHSALSVRGEPLFDIRAALIGARGNDLVEVRGNALDRNINSINKEMIHALMDKSERINEIKDAFGSIAEFEGNVEEIKLILAKKGFDLKEFGNILMSSNQMLYTSCFELRPVMHSFISAKVNQYVYNRIEVNKEVFYEKETDQFFHIVQQDSYLILIGEMTPQFVQYIHSADNLYNAFYVLYSRFEECQSDNSFLWVPSFLVRETLRGGEEQANVALSSLSRVSFPSCAYRDKTISVEHSDKDAIIANDFFLSVINMNQMVSMSNSIIYCCAVNKEAWEKSEE